MTMRLLGMPLRGVILWIHRWTGLAMAGFLIAAGLSGSVLVFKNELDAWLNPGLYRASTEGPQLTTSELVARVEAVDPHIRAATIPLIIAPGEAARFGVAPRVDPATGRYFKVDYDQVFVDPVSGRILGTRESDDALMPQIYEFHYTLLAPEGLGKLALGVVAIVWTVNCFIGLYLTWPRRRPYLVQWKPAWFVRNDIGFYRFNFDLHRAGGLWLWGVLLVLAVTSIYLNLNFEVVRPVLSTVSKLSPNIYDADTYGPRLRLVAQHPDRTILPIDRILELVRTEMKKAGEIERPSSHISHFPPLGVYRVLFHASQFQRRSGLNTPILYFDDSSGELVNATFFGRLSAGDEFLKWQYPLHSGRIAGWAGRIVIFIAGLATAMLSITGVYVWWKKRQRRKTAPRR